MTCTCLYNNTAEGASSIHQADARCPEHGGKRMTTEYEVWDGEYVKEPYLALIRGKEIPCWPNAGRMNALDGSGRSWVPKDNIKVRICTVAEHCAASGMKVPDWAKDEKAS